MRFFLLVSKSECVGLGDFEHVNKREGGTLHQWFSMTAKRGVQIGVQCTVIERLGDELTGRDCIPRSAKETEDGSYRVTGVVVSQYPIRGEDRQAIVEAMNRAAM